MTPEAKTPPRPLNPYRTMFSTLFYLLGGIAGASGIIVSGLLSILYAGGYDIDGSRIIGGLFGAVGVAIIGCGLGYVFEEGNKG